MKYSKYTIETVVQAEDIIISMLDDMGVEGAQIEDKIPLSEEELAGMFVDIGPEETVDDGKAYISFYLYASQDHEDMIRDIKAELDDMKSYLNVGSCLMTYSETEDEDYINNWKKYFHQFFIDDLLVIPSWEEPEDLQHTGKILHIDPGTAFGTGAHETTRLCIREIRKYVTPQTKILDVGCGSGILAIVALMYGAKSAKGTDLDPCALTATLENMEQNGIAAEDFEVIIGNIINDKSVQDWAGYECYDIVVANILHNVLQILTPVIVNQLKPGGIYITSGIIAEKEDFVADVIKNAGLTIVEINHDGEWVSITARK